MNATTVSAATVIPTMTTVETKPNGARMRRSHGNRILLTSLRVFAVYGSMMGRAFECFGVLDGIRWRWCDRTIKYG